MRSRPGFHEGVSIFAIGASLIFRQYAYAQTAAATDQPTTSSDPAEIIVTASRYQAPSSLNRIPLSVLETPSSFSSLTSEELNFRAPTNVRDALAFVPGVSLRQKFGIRIRGIDVGEPRQDGLVVVPQFDQDYWTLDRIEVIRGPATVLGGASSGGGLVNTVSKRADLNAGTFAQVQAIGGTYSYANAAVDGNFEVGSNAAGRIVASYRHDGLFELNSQRNSFAVLPSFTVKLGERTTFTAIGEVQSYRATNQTDGVPLHPDGTIPNLPLNFNCCGGSYNHQDFARGIAILDHDFLNDLKLSARIGYSEDTNDTEQAYPYAYDYANSKVGLGPAYLATAYWRRNKVKQRTLTGEIFVTKSVKWHGREQQVMIGSDFQAFRYDRADRCASTQGICGFGTTTVDLRNPIFLPAPFIDLNKQNVDFTRDTSYGTLASRNHQESIFGQVVLRPLKGVTVLASLRHDWVKITSEQLDTFGAFRTLSDSVANKVLSYRVGVTWEFLPSVSVYGTTADTFAPQFGFTRSGTALRPETAVTYETGVKAGFFKKQLVTTVAFFRTDRTDLEQRDLESTGQSFAFVNRGKLRYQGFELEASGRITSTIDINAAYTYLNTSVQDNGSPPFQVGDPATNDPERTLNLWLEYKALQSSLLHGLSLGAGVYNVTSTPVFGVRRNDPGKLILNRVPGYTVISSAIGYDFNKHLTLQLNADNLGDVRYLASPSDLTRGNVFGKARNFQVLVRVKY